MQIREHLEAILEGAANRPADQKTGDTAPNKITDDVTKQGAHGGDTHKDRIADQSGEEAVKQGTQINDPSGKIEQGKGTEVQGNTTGAMKGLGEDVSARVQAKLAESAEFKLDLSGLKGLLESQELTEEFQAQAVEIFEAAINDVATTHLGKINEAAAQIIESEIEAAVTTMESEVDAYLNAVVNEWLEENQVAVESGIQTRVAESFMEGLAGLLEAHNIVLPEEKKDLYEEAISKGQEILDLYENAIAHGQELLEENAALRKAAVLESVVAGLPETQAEKLRTLAEDVNFEDEESFTSKMKSLSEGYVKAKVDSESLTEDNTPVVEKVEDQPKQAIVEDETVKLILEAMAKLPKA